MPFVRSYTGSSLSCFTSMLLPIFASVMSSVTVSSPAETATVCLRLTAHGEHNALRTRNANTQLHVGNFTDSKSRVCKCEFVTRTRCNV